MSLQSAIASTKVPTPRNQPQKGKTIKEARTPGGMSPLSNSPWPGIIKLYPARESFVRDIPAAKESFRKEFL
jgi:hypothetical protein